ncbi:MAG: hypothetical protein LBT56_04940 [Prevotellaceae bacterium]|jgi:hypothetical protein|nr:hypothetical protein [Prevotellaceae bacterium]
MNDETHIKLPDKLKNTPFSVPNGYFDTLPEQIMQKCTGKKVEKISLWKSAKPMLSFAAGFLLLVGISKAILTVVSTEKTESVNYISQTTDEEIMPVLHENEMSDEMEDEIISYLVDEHYISMTFIEDEYIP